MSEKKPLVARNLAWIIEKRGLNANSLAAAMAEANPGDKTVPQATIHRILEGQHKSPRNTTLQPIATFLRVSLSELLEWDFQRNGWPKANRMAEMAANYPSPDPARDAWLKVWDNMENDEKTFVFDAVNKARELYAMARGHPSKTAAVGGGNHLGLKT